MGRVGFWTPKVGDLLWKFVSATVRILVKHPFIAKMSVAAVVKAPI